jgi:hypothetical protein
MSVGKGDQAVSRKTISIVRVLYFAVVLAFDLFMELSKPFASFDLNNPAFVGRVVGANHAHMMAIYFMHYNFVRIHQTLKVTPAMAARVTPKLWEMSDMGESA